MARTTRDDIDKFFDYGLEIGSRTVYISQDDTPDRVDDVTAEFAIKALHMLDRSDGGITIKLNCPGGDVYQGFAIYDAISGCRNEVTAIGYGQVISMGVIIMQAADRRLLTPHATMMWHYGMAGFDGHGKDFELNAAENKRLAKLCDDVLLPRIRAKSPSYSAARLRHQFQFDTYLSATEAIELGLADELAF